jgi:RibD C-terminal domain
VPARDISGCCPPASWASQSRGAATVNQYLAAGLIDELRLHVVPVGLGAGERLLVGAPHAELELLGQPRATLSSRTCDTASFAERASRPFHSQRVRIEGALPMGRAGFEPATDGL